MFFFFVLYNQIQHKLQMSSASQLDYQQELSDPAYRAHMKARQEREAALAAAYAANLAAANAAAASSYNAADIIAENARRRQEIHKQIDSITCPDCKRLAKITEDINTRCPKCKKPQRGYKRKSKSQRRKKSKSQRRRKSIKRRH